MGWRFNLQRRQHRHRKAVKWQKQTVIAAADAALDVAELEWPVSVSHQLDNNIMR